MIQNNPNYKKINNYTLNPILNLPRFSKDDNLKRFFPNALKPNRGLQNSNDIINYQTEANAKLTHDNSLREFGKDLTNYQIGSNFNLNQNGNSSLMLEKKPSLNSFNNNNVKISNYIKPIKKREESKRKLKNEPSLYNLRSRGNISFKNNSGHNSFSSNNPNNENVNLLNVDDSSKNSIIEVCKIPNKKSEISLNNENSGMDIDMNCDSNKMNVDVIDYGSQNLNNNIEQVQEISFRSRLSLGSNGTNNKGNNNTFSFLDKNPQKVSDYIEDIYSHLKSTEGLFCPQFGYMKNQRDINEKMRGILIDWLVDVHLKFKLLPETLFLSTELIDRYLEKVEINRNKLQLVGVSSLFIACKYEEIYPPELKDFVYITDKAYSKEEILKMEYEILRSLDFNITSPSSLRLLEAYIEIFQLKWEDQQLFFAKYLLELFLVDYRMIKYSPSWIAASTIYITMKVKKFNTIDGTKTIDMPKVTGYTDEKIKECARDICIVLDNAERSSLQAVRNKYSSSKFLEVAKWKKN